VVADLHKDRGDAAAAEIAKQNGKAIGVTADVSSAPDVDRMLERALDEWGRVDILVNNAGIILQAQSVDMSLEQWNKILTKNLGSCFLCSQAAARQMIQQGGGGRIANISSIHAELSEPSAGAYTAAKGGM
jgi:glucose 1-dehydrogenase